MPNSSHLSHLTRVAFCLLVLISLTGCGEEEPDAAGEDLPVDTTAATAEESDTEALAATEPGEGSGADVETRDAAGKPAYRLTLSPKVGEQYSFRLVSNTSTKTGRIVQEQNMTYDFDVRVRETAPASTTLQLDFTRVRATISGTVPRTDSAGRPIVDTAGLPQLTQQSASFDTHGRSDREIVGGARYQALVNTPLTVRLNSEATITGLDGIEKVIAEMLRLEKVPQDSLPRQTRQLLLSTFQSEVAGVVTALFLADVPDSAIGVGTSWSRVDSTPLMGLPARATVTYKLSEVEKRDARTIATIAASLNTNFLRKTLENEMMSMKITDVSQSGSSRTLVSLSSGFPVSKETSISVRFSGTGTLKEGAGPRAGESQSMTQQMKVVRKLTRTGYSSGQSDSE